MQFIIKIALIALAIVMSITTEVNAESALLRGPGDRMLKSTKAPKSPKFTKSPKSAKSPKSRRMLKSLESP